MTAATQLRGGSVYLVGVNQDALFLRRCFTLARLGAGYVSPNPQVGAVIVHQGRIIGEGWHQVYGQAHAEVNAVASVSAENQHLLSESTLYCSLEPCFHVGKTPPCVDLVLAKKIPRVVISNLDPNPLVAGQSVAKLRAAGVEVVTDVLTDEGAWLNRAFFTRMAQRRPYVILKWAQSADGYLGRVGERTPISGPLVRRLVHRWRAESDAVLVGTTTALVDNPRLDTRDWGASPAVRPPLRVVLDFGGKMPAAAHLLDDSQPTWVLGPPRDGVFQNTEFQNVIPHNWLPELLERLYAAHRAIVLAEGGANILQQWLASELWDEIRVIRSPQHLGNGVAAPGLPPHVRHRQSMRVAADSIDFYTRF